MMKRIGLEGSSKTESEMAIHLLDSNSAGDITSICSLLLDLFGPAFGDTLLDGIGVGKGPSIIEISISNGFAGVTTPIGLLRWLSTITRPTVLLVCKLSDLAHVVL